MKKTRFLSLLILIVFVLPTALVAQDSNDESNPNGERDSANKAVWNVLPLVFYSPETEFGFGVGGVVSFRFKGEPTDSRKSQVTFGAAYTLLDQILLYLPYRLWWNDEKYLAYGEVGYYKYVYEYYGIGPRTDTSMREFYDFRLARFRGDLLQEFWPDTYLGARYSFDHFPITDVEDGGLLDTRQDRDTAGGRIGALGPVLNIDSRDNQFYPTRGWYFELLALPHIKAFGSEWEFLRLSMDAVKYIPLDDDKKHTLVGNVYLETNIGDVPFLEMGLLGGTRRMRGMYEGRFRDHNAAIVQAEYRWAFWNRFGAVAFGALGNVADRPENFDLALTKHAFGGGIRFQLSKKEEVNVRLDYGYMIGEGGNFYLTFGEAF